MEELQWAERMVGNEADQEVNFLAGRQGEEHDDLSNSQHFYPFNCCVSYVNYTV